MSVRTEHIRNDHPFQLLEFEFCACLKMRSYDRVFIDFVRGEVYSIDGGDAVGNQTAIEDILCFLEEAKQLLSSGKYDFVPRRKNMQALARLGLPSVYKGQHGRRSANLSALCVTFVPRTSGTRHSSALIGLKFGLPDSATSAVEIRAIFKADDRGVLDVHRLRITPKIARIARHEASCPLYTDGNDEGYKRGDIRFGG